MNERDMNERDDKPDCIPVEFKSPLPYPEIKVQAPNMQYAKLILEDYAGSVSELTAIMLYTYQEFVIINPKYKEIADTLKAISIVEMTHMKMLSQLIIKLGLKPKFYADKKDKLQYWDAAYVNYNTAIDGILLEAIQSEKKAIMQYRQHISMIKDKSIDELLERIIVDEELHLRKLMKLYRSYIRGRHA